MIIPIVSWFAPSERAYRETATRLPPKPAWVRVHIIKIRYIAIQQPGFSNGIGSRTSPIICLQDSSMHTIGRLPERVVRSALAAQYVVAADEIFPFVLCSRNVSANEIMLHEMDMATHDNVILHRD
jgi:hypothetical protein